MEIIVVEPHGYCAGVCRALALARKAKAENPEKRIFLLGAPVHNEIATRSLEQEGFVLLDEREKTLESHLLSLERGDIVVFSAHGHPEALDRIAKEKGVIPIDATCPFVDANRKKGQEMASCKLPLFYLGTRGHLEAESFLANVPDSQFIDARHPEVHPSGRKALLISQTTLSDSEVDRALAVLKTHFAEVDVLSARCGATEIRQKAIRALPRDCDALIVLGSSASNNSRKLAEIGREIGLESHLVLDAEGLRGLPLGKYRKIALAAGASTPPECFKRALDYLRSLP